MTSCQRTERTLRAGVVELSSFMTFHVRACERETFFNRCSIWSVQTEAITHLSKRCQGDVNKLSKLIKSFVSVRGSTAIE